MFYWLELRLHLVHHRLNVYNQNQFHWPSAELEFALYKVQEAVLPSSHLQCIKFEELSRQIYI